MGRLTATAVKAAKDSGRYGDGDGLFLLIGRTGSKSWMVRVQKDGKRRDIGLGSAAKVPLKLARERAAVVRSQVEAGIDPVLERRKAAGIPTFREAAALVHAEHKAGWKNGKHQAQWLSTLEAYAFPAFGDVSVAHIDAPAVRDALAAIWLTKPETARRLRQRIRTVIDWAVAKGYREASLAMPVIDKALPRQRGRVKHHAALPYAELPAFMAALRLKETIGRLALEALILTAGAQRRCARHEMGARSRLRKGFGASRSRTGAARAGACMSFPSSRKFWTLSNGQRRTSAATPIWCFPAFVKGKQLSDNTLRKVALDMGHPVTAHGFRSTFADWINDQTNFPREVREAALAHANGDKIEVAYSRTDYLEKRRPMMEAWASYCEGASGGNVVRLTV